MELMKIVKEFYAELYRTNEVVVDDKQERKKERKKEESHER